MNNAKSITERLHDLIRFIDEAHISVDNGSVPPIKTIEQRVVQICVEAEKSPPDIARQAQPLIAQMITKLDELAVKLQSFTEQE